MRHLGSRVRRVAVLTVPVVAISLTLGAGAAGASTAGASRVSAAADHAVPAGITWNRLTGINGWHSGQSKYGTGDPSWGISGGVVYLSGSIIRASGTSTLFAVLPSQARPAHKLWITVYTLNGTTGTLYIDTSGKMNAEINATSTSSPAGYTSLAGVSFPAKTTAQSKLTLVNGWKSSQVRWSSGDPSYTVRGGVAYLSGSLHGGTSSAFATLPAAARPASNLYLSVYTFSGSYGGIVYIGKNGTAEAYDGAATSYTSLAGISYPVASATRHPLTLHNGWVSSQGAYGTGNPSYSVINGVVYLNGSMHNASSSTGYFATLPTGARPSHYLYLKTYQFGGAVGEIQIYPSGIMWVYSDPAATSSAGQFTTLSGISFPVKS
ncbi:MAG TPA: hypothetical protein VF834_26160 [Streptosporangiaceae bacterium]